jgi:enoyl-CoA hydratase
MGFIQIDKKDNGIAIVILNRPDVHNSFNTELLNEFQEKLEMLKIDKSVRVLILTGSGEKSFSSGVDLKSLQNLKNIEDAREFAILLEGTSEKLFNFPKPVISAINGYALGGGMGYASSTDYRIIVEDTKIGFPAAKLGAILPVTCTLYLSSLIGLSNTRDLLLTGRMLDGNEAKELGLINKVVKKEDLMKEAFVIAEQIMESTDMALLYTKKTINSLLATNIQSQKLYAADNFAFLSQTKEWKERINNFGKK